LQDVQEGRVAVCNISRRMVPWSRIHLPKVTVVEVTAPVELLRERLAGRARIEDGDLNARLARSLEVWTPVDATIVNDRTVEEAGRELAALITSHTATCRADGPVEERLVPRFN
jgi:ribose 1,5-bisphosphokinase